MVIHLICLGAGDYVNYFDDDWVSIEYNAVLVWVRLILRDFCIVDMHHCLNLSIYLFCEIGVFLQTREKG